MTTPEVPDNESTRHDGMEPAGPPTGNPLVQAWLVLLLAVVFGGGLVAVELTFGPIIEANKRAETMRQIGPLMASPPKVLAHDASEVARWYSQHFTGERDGDTGPIKVLRDGRHAGWVVPARGQGFADAIELLVGLDPEAKTITGIYVLDQKETPGLGDWITDATRFRNQFRGQPAGGLEVIKTGASEKGSIIALTGATVSSRAVADIVNAAVSNFRKTHLSDNISDNTSDVEAGGL